MIDPHEITKLARPYFEKLTSEKSGGSRIRLDRPNTIDRIIDAARVYSATANGAVRGRKQPDSENKTGLIPFGARKGEPIVPEFGFGDLKFLYIQDDLDFADRTMKSHDENKDGYIDMREAARHEWTHRQPFLDDLNKDNRLSRLELAQRYARRRMLEDDSNEFRKKEWRDNDLRNNQPKTEESRRDDDSLWWRRGGSDYWLTASLMSRFDRNKNGKLESNEVEEMGIPAVQVDPNRDGEVTREELFAHIKVVQEQAGGTAAGPPPWFHERDTNQDGQLTMPEFASEWNDEVLFEFTSYDTNSDGLLTTAEVIGNKQSTSQGFKSDEAVVLLPRQTVISEVEVTDDFQIEKLRVELSITHTYVSYLDVFLAGPDGQQIELFTAVGGSDDHFDQTVLDDDAEQPISKNRPPYTGSFKPESAERGQPSLSSFKGKSVKGVWQLIVKGTRSPRSGILHEWSLLATPKQ